MDGTKTLVLRVSDDDYGEFLVFKGMNRVSTNPQAFRLLLEKAKELEELKKTTFRNDPANL